MGQEKKIPVLYQKKEDCCGCGACLQICPVQAIQMKEDVEGFEYPEISEEKCRRCKFCQKVCPMKVVSKV